jgi:hypothetical protein
MLRSRLGEYPPITRITAFLSQACLFGSLVPVGNSRQLAQFADSKRWGYPRMAGVRENRAHAVSTVSEDPRPRAQTCPARPPR